MDDLTIFMLRKIYGARFNYTKAICAPLPQSNVVIIDNGILGGDAIPVFCYRYKIPGTEVRIDDETIEFEFIEMLTARNVDGSIVLYYPARKRKTTERKDPNETLRPSTGMH